MKKLIFLIEDDEMISEVYSTALSKNKDFNVKNFYKAKDVLNWKSDNQKPNLILLDLILPDMDGLDLLRSIRKIDYFKNVPVFIVTNYTSRELEKMSNDLNVEKYINKAELLPTELLRLLEIRLEEKK